MADATSFELIWDRQWWWEKHCSNELVHSDAEEKVLTHSEACMNEACLCPCKTSRRKKIMVWHCAVFTVSSQGLLIPLCSLEHKQTAGAFCHEMCCMDSLWSIDLLLFVYVVFSCPYSWSTFCLTSSALWNDCEHVIYSLWSVYLLKTSLIKLFHLS